MSQTLLMSPQKFFRTVYTRCFWSSFVSKQSSGNFIWKQLMFTSATEFIEICHPHSRCFWDQSLALWVNRIRSNYEPINIQQLLIIVILKNRCSGQFHKFPKDANDEVIFSYGHGSNPATHSKMTLTSDFLGILCYFSNS